LTESAAIATYAAAKAPSGKLLSSDPKVASEIAQWIAFADQEIATPMQLITGMFAGYITYTKPVHTYVLAKVESRLAALERVLNEKTFLVGERITLADIAVASVLFAHFSNGHFDKSVRSKVPNVVRFFETIVKNSKLASVFGEVSYQETAPQYSAPKKDAPAKAPKAEAAAAAPKEPKAPKAKKAAEADDEDDEPLVPAEPKAKNPLDDLPKSDFKLDDWKRAYSNEDTLTGAVPWFYKNFDSEGFSVWRVDYKYNDELTQVFMSSNLIGGFFNRLEASRKYAFGTMGVFGKSNDSLISGVFVVRGKDIEPVINVAPDWESYSYSPLDLSKDEDKAFFEKTLAWEVEVDGKAWADGKVYK